MMVNSKAKHKTNGCDDYDRKHFKQKTSKLTFLTIWRPPANLTTIHTQTSNFITSLPGPTPTTFLTTVQPIGPILAFCNVESYIVYNSSNNFLL